MSVRCFLSRVIVGSTQSPVRLLSFIYTLHKSYEFSHLHLQINKKSIPEALLFKPGVQFQLTDSEEIFLATCTFTVNRRMWTSNPGHGVNCIRCYHQSLSVSNMSYKLNRERAAALCCISVTQVSSESLVWQFMKDLVWHTCTTSRVRWYISPLLLFWV